MLWGISMFARDGAFPLVVVALAFAGCGRSRGPAVDAGDGGNPSPDLRASVDLPVEPVSTDAAADRAPAVADLSSQRDLFAESDQISLAADLAPDVGDAVRRDSAGGVDRISVVDGGGPAKCEGMLTFGGFPPMSETGGQESHYHTPEFFTLADLNGDNKLDMAVANSGTGTVGVLLGRGDGTFASPTTYATGSPYAMDSDEPAGPLSVAVGDVNGDGKPDIVSANTRPGTVSVLLGKGDGTSAEHVDLACGERPYRVVLGDLDGDKKLDIVTANYQPGTVSVLLGKGDGSFAANLDSATGDGPETVLLGDVNNDGKLDVVTANVLASTVSVLLGTGDGLLGAKLDFALGAAPMSSPAAAALGDLNGDGRLDVVVATGKVTVLLGKGDGTFAAPAHYADGGILEAWLALGDMNGDGKQDVVETGFDSIVVFLGRGDGTLAEPQRFPSGSEPQMVAIADVNSDGKADVAMGFSTPYARVAGVLLGNGDGTFASKHIPGKLLTYAMATGDLNGDGWPDIVSSIPPNRVVVLLAANEGGFALKADYAVGPSSSSYVSRLLGLADLDGDGKLDIVTTALDPNGSYNSVSLIALLGQGDGSFAPPQYAPVSFETDFLKLDDLNGDGKADIVTTNHDAGTVSVRLGKGDGTFADTKDFPAGTGPDDFALGDLNRDGKVDIVILTERQVAGNTPLASAVALLGNGDGTFARKQEIALAPTLSSLALVDMNRDDQLDVVVASTRHLEGVVSVLLGQGDGTFASELDFEVGRIVELGPLGDFDRDGNLDVMTLSQPQGYLGGGTSSLLLGKGDGTFAAAVAYPVAEPVLAASDLDGDGRLDLFGLSTTGAVHVMFSACR
jgi:hypothetical protein